MDGFRGKQDRVRHRSALAFGVSVFVVAALFAAFATVSSASGTKPTSAGAQYVVVKSAVVKQTTPKVKVATTSTAPVQSSGTLPFTGISLAGTAVLGIGLVGLGIMLRRRQPRDES